jgi:hypothetical protein
VMSDQLGNSSARAAMPHGDPGIPHRNVAAPDEGPVDRRVFARANALGKTPGLKQCRARL